MSRLCQALRVALVSVIAGCGRRDQPPPDRPSQPTLIVAPDPAAPTTGRRVVAVGQIAQPWHVGTWSPASITLSEVTAGDAILVLGVY
jgi:uracil-DNA glycosylase